MSVVKRAWLCLLLLAIHANPTISNSANVATLDKLDDDDVNAIDKPRDTEDANIPLDDGLMMMDDENETATSERIIANKSSITAAADIQPPAFLRKNNNTKPSTEMKGRGIFKKAFSKAIGGGVPGAIAGIIQVFSLMWLRTVINYQYRYGSSFHVAISTLYGMGGIRRLYSGITFALIQAPLSRFISTAANDGIGVLLQNFNWGPGREVVVAAFVVGFFRMIIMPVDTCKTVMQIEGAHGLAQLLSKVRKGHVNLLYSGALANAASSFIGHYPWFYTYNLLSKNEALIKSISWVTGRNALIGFVSSIVSDTIANFMRVIKTTKQSLGSTRSDTTYAETISLILAVDGWRGLFGRGLKTRILGNALQSIIFTVVWRGLSERWQETSDANNSINENSSTTDNIDTENTKYETKR
eukprot:CAMPEP_0201995006 /NCGR_PEP_ID=MMETSP0905-20130828/2639_1 /ASSEMBLY_ACC=CAM_ASM_000554 /TAXON_ID=420261 /ORGANISM="Thalassiosira antarctica, Strain CCMP982" /LENGTH=412 /DNA_ID=CAMNT_0048550061 /DNA_START=1 /DNA_END=1239 /DNA_ORIENTATION=-